MPKSIEEMAAEIEQALKPLPRGFFVKPGGLDDVLVGNDVLAFVITRRQLSAGTHVADAKSMFPYLMASLAAHHASSALRHIEAGKSCDEKAFRATFDEKDTSTAA